MNYLQQLDASVRYANKLLMEAAKGKIAEFKQSGFLTTDEEIQEIAREALARYQNRDAKLREHSFEVQISALADGIARDKIEAGYGELPEKIKELESDEKIKQFIVEDYNKGLWTFYVNEILIQSLREKIHDAIIPCITPLLTKENVKNSGSCTIL